MPEISDAELRLFARYQNIGTPEEIQKKITDLEKDNGSQRDMIRDLKEKQPKENEVVLPKADAEKLKKYSELGKPEDLKKQVEEGAQAKSELAEVTRRTQAQAFAKAAGLADETVDTLIALPALQGADFSVEKGKVKNDRGVEEEKDIAFVTLPGEEGKAGEKLKFADAQEKVPALKGLRTAEAAPPQKQNVGFVKQGGGSEGGSTTIYDRIRQQREAEKKASEEKPKVKPIEERLGVRSQA